MTPTKEERARLRALAAQNHHLYGVDPDVSDFARAIPRLLDALKAAEAKAERLEKAAKSLLGSLPRCEVPGENNADCGEFAQWVDSDGEEEWKARKVLDGLTDTKKVKAFQEMSERHRKMERDQ